MAFNAGAIEASLTLDRSDFNRELKGAQSDAQKFAKQTFAASLGLDTKQFTGQLKDAQDKLAKFGGASPTAKLNVSNDRANSEVDETTAKVDAFGRKSSTAKVNVSTSSASSDLEKLTSQVFSLSTAIIGLGPAIVPATAGLVGAAVAVGSAFASAAGGVGIFALAVKDQVKNAVSSYGDLQKSQKAVSTAQAELSTATTAAGRAAAQAKLDVALKAQAEAAKALSPAQRQAAQSMASLKDAFSNFGAGAKNQVLGTFAIGADAATRALKALEPVVAPVTAVINQFVTQIDKGIKSGGLNGLVTWLKDTAPGAIRAFLNAGRDFGAAMINIFSALSGGGSQQKFLTWIQNVAAEFRKWTEGPGLTSFVNYIKQYMPQVLSFLGQLVTFVKNVTSGLGGLAGLEFTGLVKFLPILNNVLQQFPLVAPTILLIVQAWKLWNIVLAAWDLIMDANPIGLIVIGLVALGVALVTAYQKSTTFRNIVNAAFADLKAAWSATWTVLKAGFNGMVVAFGAISNAASATIGFIESHWKLFASGLVLILTGPLGEIVLQVALHWQQIESIFTTAIKWVTTHWDAMWTAIEDAEGAALSWIRGAAQSTWSWITGSITSLRNLVVAGWNLLWNTVKSITGLALSWIRGAIQATFTWFQVTLTNLKNWTINTWNLLWNTLKSLLGLALAWIRNAITNSWNVVRATFNTFSAAVRATWTTMWNSIKSITNDAINDVKNAVNGLANGVKATFNGLVSSSKSIWNGIKGAVATPINFVTQTAYGKLQGFAGKVLSIVGVKNNPLPSPASFKISGYARGGVVGDGILPGYSPGKDNMIASSPYGPVGLAGGEGILRPEVMKAPGMATFLGDINKVARSSGIGGVKSVLGYADGGIVGGVRTVANFDGGGIFGGLLSGIGGAASKVGGIALSAIDKLGLTGLISQGVSKVYDSTIGGAIKSGLAGIDKDGLLGQVDAHSATTVFADIVKYLTGQVGSSGGGTGADQKALAWAKTQWGKAYQWGGNGDPSWDCSGYMSAIESVIRGEDPHRRWATGSFGGSTAPDGWVQNLKAPFMIGVENDDGVGHTAGTLLGVNVESNGSGGVHGGVGVSRGYNDPLFQWQYGFKPSIGANGPTSNVPQLGGSYQPAIFTSFDDPTTASGIIRSSTIASSYLPLGSVIEVNLDGHQEEGTVDDLGPADFVYARHSGEAVFDLNTGMAARMTGSSEIVAAGGWKLVSVGSGRTLYGESLRGYSGGGVLPVHAYDNGGDMPPGMSLNWNGTNKTESVITAAQREEQNKVNNAILSLLGEGGGKSGDKNFYITPPPGADPVQVAREVIQRATEGL